MAEVSTKVVGVAWVHIMNNYRHINGATPSFAISLYKEYRGLVETAVKNNLAFLKENGYVERVGSKKTGYWKVVE